MCKYIDVYSLTPKYFKFKVDKIIAREDLYSKSKVKSYIPCYFPIL